MSLFADTATEPFGEGQKANVGGLSEGELLRTLRNYKAQIAKRYRAVPPEQLAQALPEAGLWISPKIDGELWFLVKRAGEIALCATNGRVIVGTSTLAEADTALGDAPDLIVAGELYAASLGSDDRPRPHHVSLALGAEPREEALAFAPFDLVELAGADQSVVPYGKRLETLAQWFADGVRVRLVATEEGGATEAKRLYQERVVSNAFEGIVVRTGGGVPFKIKSTLTIDAVVVAYGERVVQGVAEVRELSLAVLRPDGGYQLISTVGNGFAGERES